MNRELLIKVRDQIAAHPQHFDMQDFLYGTPSAVRNHVCGTTACIAGWAILLTDRKYLAEYLSEQFSFHDTARDLLDIPEDVAQKLFYVDEWPDEFLDRYMDITAPAQVVVIAVDYINQILENGVPA